jgi:hypothetical protein
MIGSCHRDRVNISTHLVEHLTEIVEKLSFRVPLDDSSRPIVVNITNRNRESVTFPAYS